MDEPIGDPSPTTSEPDGQTDGVIEPPGTRARSGRTKVKIIAGLAGLLVIPGALIVLALLAGSVASTAFWSDRLPPDFRSGLEIRLKAVVPSNFDQLTATERSAWFDEQLQRGLVRLDDATLVRRYRLRATAVGQLPVAACASFGRKTATGAARSAAILTALGVDELKAWAEIQVEAVEAEARGTPVPRIVTDDEFDAVAATRRGLVTPDESSAIQAQGDGTTQSDAAVCAGVRATQGVGLRLPTADLATLARYNVQP